MPGCWVRSQVAMNPPSRPITAGASLMLVGLGGMGTEPLTVSGTGSLVDLRPYSSSAITTTSNTPAWGKVGPEYSNERLGVVVGAVQTGLNPKLWCVRTSTRYTVQAK